MKFIRTTAIDKLLCLSKRIKGVPGGTGASKTVGILAILIDTACRTPNWQISVVSESYPHLSRGAIKDFQAIMKSTGRWVDGRWLTSKSRYKFGNGATIEFFSVDDPAKVHGPRRNELYVNECNRINFSTYHNLSIRTSHSIWLDFNPTRKFWYHKEVRKDEDFEEVVLTYLDNEAYPRALIKELLKAKAKADGGDEYWRNWWNVYGLGQLGTLEGQIFADVKHCKDIPEDAASPVFGLDFGYVNDPTALVQVNMFKGGLYRKQIFYESDLEMEKLINVMYSAGVDEKMPILCDHDHVAIKQLVDAGFNAMKAKKLQKMVGIQALKQIPIFTTFDSQDLINEEDNYFFVSKNGEFLNKPVDEYDHGWDATRYAHHYILNPTDKYYLGQRFGRAHRRKVFAG